MYSTAGSWPTANGASQPVRPPTVDEALPYSPFTSILPFSPDIIPYPSAEPPTPPTTLTSDQQESSRKAYAILNAELRGPLDTAQLAVKTLDQLHILINSDEPTYFEFKSPSQLLTPPPESPHTVTIANGNPSVKPSLSPFATMLMKGANIHYKQPGVQPSKPQKSQATPKKPTGDILQSATPPLPLTVVNKDAQSQNAGIQYASTHLPATPSGTPSRAGPAAVIGQSSDRREEFRGYGVLPGGDGISNKKRHVQTTDEGSTLTRQQREIAQRNIFDLTSLVDDLLEAKEDVDDWKRYFVRVACDGSELTTLRHASLENLEAAMRKVMNIGSLGSVSREVILNIQALCEPSISVTGDFQLDPLGPAASGSSSSEAQDWADDLIKAQDGLLACRIVLQTMTSGSEDRQTCSEDTISLVVKALKNVQGSCLLEIMLSRPNSESPEVFRLAKDYKDILSRVLSFCGRILRLLADLVGNVKLTELALSPVEDLARKTIFIQSGETEKDSAFGVHATELLRQKAGDVLVQVFASHDTTARTQLLDDLLTEIPKLSDKASARQFKSPHGANIMPMSALLMRLVQAAASRTRSQRTSSTIGNSRRVEQTAEEDSDDDQSQTMPRRNHLTNRSPEQTAALLSKSALSVASRIIQTIVNKALDSAKGENKAENKPLRNLLDMFIHDFGSSLGQPEWPGATLLLDRVLGAMANILNDKDRLVNDRYLALNSMSTMACDLVDFLNGLNRQSRGLDISQSELSNKLVHLAEDAHRDSVSSVDLLAFDGPYRIVLESLPGIMNVGQDDPYLESVTGCHVTLWAQAFQLESAQAKDGEIARQDFLVNLKPELMRMVDEPNWLSREYGPRKISEPQSIIAASILVSQSQFCKCLPGLVNVFLNNTRNSSANLQSKAMSALTAIHDKDPKVFNEKTFVSLSGLLKDNSAKVRENTLQLIAKCLEANPELEKHCLDGILERVSDPSLAPRKRALRLLKDIYLKSTSREKQLKIAAELLIPVQDHETTVAELACQILEEMWLPLSIVTSKGDDSRLKLERSNRAALLVDIVRTIEKDPSRLDAFEKFFTDALSSKAKNTALAFELCKGLVNDMLDSAIDNANSRQARILHTLSIFAKAKPALFTANQMQLLTAYINKPKSAEDLALLRPTATIFRHVFPSLPTIQVTFAEEVYFTLNENISSLAQWVAQGQPYCKETLLDVIHCLYTIRPLVKGGGQPPVRHQSGIQRASLQLSSTLVQLVQIQDPKDPKQGRKARILLCILGAYAKVWSLDSQLDEFKQTLKFMAQKAVDGKPAQAGTVKALLQWKGPSVSELFITYIMRFVKDEWDVGVRKQALCSIGEVCQSAPENFQRNGVEQSFHSVFEAADSVEANQLKQAILENFRDFFSITERKSESGADIAVGEGAKRGAERLTTSLVGSNAEGAPLHLARTFLPKIVDVATTRNDSLALLATKVIISISHQGLVHPKECGPALVVLGTSPTPQISTIASSELHGLHLKHESMMEKEYVAAVFQAFTFQQKVFRDTRGLIDKSYKPKLSAFFHSLNEGKKGTGKRFVANLLKRINFELPKLDSSGSSDSMPETALFAGFCLESLGLFDFRSTDEIYHVKVELEKIVLKQTGPTVALALEVELPKDVAEPELQQQDVSGENEAVVEPLDPNANPQAQAQESITEERLRHLATASMILRMMWATRDFILKAWSFPVKPAQADLKKTYNRTNFVTGKEIYDKFSSILTGLDSRPAMIHQCRELTEIINVDKDHGVEDEDLAAEEDGMVAEDGYETPTEGRRSSTPGPTSGRGRKRKTNVPLGNTPKKMRVRPKGAVNKKRTSKTPEDGEQGWDWH
ncbi:hypothetical protein EJ04DRAFT_463476 [Polyplosphaeria fusca]|uniref:Sister chromatid cohesion protein n=1 Tax=Polyplosphaeria fusca TaxID=682080 RepID=A0A9P4QYS6_9PLEO|nr:hypothetical protein EJ04DRAFT_463476 [Polyplosphaeria fusca]